LLFFRPKHLLPLRSAARQVNNHPESFSAAQENTPEPLFCVVFLRGSCLYYLLSIEREEFWKAANSFVRLFAPLAGKMWVHVISKKKSLRGEEKYQRESYFGALSAAMHRKVLYMVRLRGFPRVHCFCFSSPPRFTLSVQNSGGKEGRPLATESEVYILTC
jgi:hypothetical protein